MNNKFIVLEKHGSLFFSTKILCDIKTEIVYVWIRKGYSAGLSVLLKSDGTPYKKNEYLKEQNKL